MQKFSQRIGGVAAVAILTMAATAAWAQDPDAPKVADQAEFDLYDAVTKDMLANNGAKAVTDLDAWKQHNPTSEYKWAREVLYVRAYQLAKDWDKVLLKVKELMSQDLDKIYPNPASGPQNVVNILFGAVSADLSLPAATPAQMEIGVDAAHKLLDYKREPTGLAPGAWETAMKQVQDASNALLYRAAIAPAAALQAQRDWPGAEAAWTKAAADYPDKAMIAYNLGIVLRQQGKRDQAIWQFARAIAIDPTLEKSQNGTTITNFVKNDYKNLHGSEDGLDQIQQQAKASASAPSGFHVETAAEISDKKQKEFATSHPDIALFMNLKATLTSDQGAQYFEGSMKGAQVPELSGTVLESACRAKELKVAVPLPDATGPPTAEITLKLVNDAGAASPLTGKAEAGRITFQGVAEAYTKDPFMLTMTIDKKAIKDLKVTPCAAAAPARKGVTKKK